MNVLLLGAGASKGYGESASGVRMPIAVDFFKTFRSLDVYNHPWVLKDKLFHYILSDRGIDAVTFLNSSVNIEDLHSEIEEKLVQALEAHSTIDRIKYYGTFQELSFIFACVVNAVQNGPPSKPHIRLAQRLTDRDIVLTFNWDTLMDRALAESTAWNPDSGYAFKPRQIFRDGWKEPLRRPNVNAPKILKLHGSSNWITGLTIHREAGIEFTQAASPDAIWVFEHAIAPYACYGGRFMPGYAPFSYGYYPPNIQDDTGKSAPEGYVFVRMDLKPPWRPEGTAPKDGLLTMPLIIPPIRHKRYDLYGPLFNGLWSKAETALKEAVNIIIIGYSFPETDLQSHSLFTRAFIQRSTIPNVVILNPHPDRVAEKMRHEFGIPNANLLVIRDYFDESFDLDRIMLP